MEKIVSSARDEKDSIDSDNPADNSVLVVDGTGATNNPHMERFNFGKSRSARMATAVARAVDEHGAPNVFSPGELAALYADKDLRPVDFGRRHADIAAVLRRHGYEVEYRSRRFMITTASSGGVDT